MIPYYEPSVFMIDEKKIAEFDLIAKRLGLTGYLIMGKAYSKKKTKKTISHIEHISRLEIQPKNISELRKELQKQRPKCEILSVRTDNPKIAQWVVKDNRVDIVTIPGRMIKEIITKQFANVAADNQTFIEINLQSLLDEEKNRSISLRNLSRTMNIILQMNAPFVFSLGVKSPYEFKAVRSVIALCSLIGVSNKKVKESLKLFNKRIKTNQEKLAEGFISEGISLVKEHEPTEKGTVGNIIDYEIPQNLKERQLGKITLERQRYLLFEILSEKKTKLLQKEFEDLIWTKFNSLFGVVGSSQLGFYVTHFNKEKQFGIIRCSHKYLTAMRAVLAILTQIEEKPVIFHVMKVSGTLKNLLKIAQLKEEEKKKEKK
ncbi:MAG: RNase P subunit p30 family protein [Candidatus Heimdallarchaeota archaeon]